MPQTIAVIPRAAIEQQGATTLSEALRNVPGITLQAGEGGGASNTAGDMFNMRGFNASNSLFVDGVRDDGLVSRDVFNIEQVEVFMGPDRLRRRPRHGGRLRQHADARCRTWASSSAATFAYGNGDQWPRHGRPQLRELRQFRQLVGQVGSSSERACGRTAACRAATRSSRRAARLRRLSPSVSDTPTRLTASAQILRQDNLPDYGIPGAAWQEEPLDADDDPDAGAGRPEQLLRQSRVRSRRRRAG